jgi:hypothetical protein
MLIMVEYLTNLSTNIDLHDLTIEQLGIIIAIICGIIGTVSGLIGAWTGRKALRISNYMIFPDIEFEYILKNIDLNYLEKRPEYKENFDKFNERYTNKYSHLILINTGQGKAYDVDVAYNWDLYEEDIIEGDIPFGGLSSEYLIGYKVVSKKYLSKEEESLWSIPTIDFGRDEYEKARVILIRVKYKDIIGNTYCKCQRFMRERTERQFNKIDTYSKTCRIGLLKKISIYLFDRSCLFEEKEAV